MSNALYTKAREAFLNADIDWQNDNIKVLGVDATYIPNLDTHQYLSDITGTVATSGNLAGKTFVGGVADADNITLPLVTGPTIVRLIIFQDTGTAGTSRLIAMLDSATRLPVTPDGTNIDITWNNGTSKIFRI